MSDQKRGPGRPKTDGPKKEKRVTFRMEQAEYDHLKELSVKEGLTVGCTINRAIEYYYHSQK